MKYPISINDRELVELQKLGKMIGIDSIHNTYGSIPRILKFGVTFSIQMFEKLESGIPCLHPDQMDILFQHLKNKKTLEYHRKMREFKAKSITHKIKKEEMV